MGKKAPLTLADLADKTSSKPTKTLKKRKKSKKLYEVSDSYKNPQKVNEELEDKLEHESLPLFPENKQEEASKPSELKKDVKPRGRPRKLSESVGWRRREEGRKLQKLNVCDLPPRENKLLNLIGMYSFDKSIGGRIGDFFVIEIKISELKIENLTVKTIQTYLNRLRKRNMLDWIALPGKYTERKFRIPWDTYLQTDIGMLRHSRNKK